MQIAVTGGTGRIGNAVLELALARGHTVVSIDQTAPAQPETRPGVTFYQVNMSNYDEVEKAFAGCEAVVHMAAIPSPGRHPDHVVHNNNVTGSYNALRAAAELGIKKVCQASSVNATGLSYSRWPHFDYFPLDEKHPTYNEDPYSLSKWICEIQGDSFARRYEDMTISSLRFSWVINSLDTVPQMDPKKQSKNLWGYTLLEAAARSCLAGIEADYKGHEVFYITAPNNFPKLPSSELAQEIFPDVPLRPDFDGTDSFFDCSKAERLLGWKHDLS